MFPLIVILFLAVPIVEIYLLIQVGQVIGAAWTILLVVLTAVIGAWLLRIQGLSTLLRAQQRLQDNQLPAREILEGMALVVAGARIFYRCHRFPAVIPANAHRAGKPRGIAHGGISQGAGAAAAAEQR